MEPSVTANRLSTKTYQLFSDYHSHPQGHRVQSYTQALLQPWADSARRSGLLDIAFTITNGYNPAMAFEKMGRLRTRNRGFKSRRAIDLINDPIHSPAAENWVENNWD